MMIGGDLILFSSFYYTPDHDYNGIIGSNKLDHFLNKAVLKHSFDIDSTVIMRLRIHNLYRL